MESAQMITAEQARELFDYNPETGIVTRKVTTSSRAKRGYTITDVSATGYLRVRFQGKQVHLHRVIWLIQTGDWPLYEIDHIDRNKLNNRWLNLRDVTCVENLQNRGSTQGGVYLNTTSNSWQAKVTHNGKQHYIGYSKDKAMAEYMYELYIAKHFPHKL